MSKEMLIQEIERVKDSRVINQLFNYMVFIQLNNSYVYNAPQPSKTNEQNKYPYSSGLPKVHASFDTTKYISDMREDKELV
ncbi:hypothetical protein FACS1894156_0520 [Bacteroidia bacterium]|nr:hypothetical protein FACS1894156_0520 [Bacteroidia bacterium]